MGCCASTPANDPARYGQQGNSSSRAINTQQPQPNPGLPRPSTVASTQSNRPQAPPLAAHVNQPIKTNVFTSKRLWTRAELDRERVEFFDTRVTGRQEMWQAIRAALEILWAGSVPEDVATAQQILDAAGLTVPTGSLHRGIYDSLGALYQVPEYIVSDPVNILDTPSAVDGAGAGGPDRPSGDTSSSSELDEEELARRREEKGKAVLSPKDMMPIRARLSDTGGDLRVSIGKNDSVRLICQQILEDAGRSPPQHIRIAYLGKILDEKQTLIAQGWQEGHVVNALVFN